ncbi:MAG TPA: phage baseplate assembly protein V [Rubrivivax sp.]
MPVSPLENAEGPVRVALSRDGESLQASAALVSVTVCRAVNEVPSATLVFADGDMALQAFPLSDSPQWRPGAEVSVKAGYGDNEAAIFSGIVVKHGLRIGGDNEARLVIECRDRAVKMTFDRKNRQYLDQSDADIVSDLISGHGLEAVVRDAVLRHAQLVQHDCTDWDFLLSRAEANSCLVSVLDGEITVAEPAITGAAALKLSYGQDLIEFEADLDWAQAQPPEPALARVCGRMRFQGSALVEVGGPIELAGIGERFSGTVLTTRLTHRIDQGGWTTEVEFGMPVERPTERPRGVAPPAAGRVPGIEGLHVGTVIKLDDPAGEHRVQVQLPAAGVESVWARLVQFSASNAFGAFFVPEVGDDVLLGFLSNDPASPVVLGSLYSNQRPPAQSLTAGNPVKSIVTRCKARIEFNDEDQTVTVATPGHNTVVLNDKDKSVTVSDQNGSKVRLGPAGITLDSTTDIQISASGAIVLSALGALTLSAGADVRVAGLNVTCEAQVGITATGSASAELSAGGQTTVKGAMVMIN